MDFRERRSDFSQSTFSLLTVRVCAASRISPAVHLALDQFDAVYVALHGPRAPVKGESGLHSQPVAMEVAAKATQFRRTGRLNIGNPLIELGPASLPDKDHELLCQSSAHGQLTAPAAQSSKKYAFGVVQFRTASQ